MNIFRSNPKRYLMIIIPGLILCGGCRATKPAGGISSREDLKDLGKVASSVTGKSVSEQDLINLNKQMREDPQARSAVETITGSMAGGQRPVKYCPVDGERYASNITNCPVHGTELLELKD